MMSGSELATAIAAALGAAVAVGWILHWLWSRLAMVATTDGDRIAELVAELDSAHEARETAEVARAEAEAARAEREAELTREIQTLRRELEARLAGREAELTQQLREARAEAQTAWDGLGNARRHIRELEAELNALQDEERPG